MSSDVLSSSGAPVTFSALQARLQQRAAGLEEKQSNATITSQNYVLMRQYLSDFESSRNLIECEMSRLLSSSASLDVQSELLRLSGLVADLQAKANQHAHLLPSYDLRQNKLCIQSLDESLSRIHDQLLPRKRFTFTSKRKKRDSAIANKPVAPPSSSVSLPPSTASDEQRESEDTLVENNNTGFYRKSNRVLTKRTLLTQQDCMLSHLKDCTICMLDTPSAMRCHQLENCQIIVGPISGSVLIYGAKNCVFILAARQLRIHDCHNCSFFLHVASSPIIEHSSACGFADYKSILDYSQLSTQLKSTQLADVQSKYATVEDFNWLRQQQSPNWHLIPPTRYARLTLSAVDEEAVIDMDNDYVPTAQQEQQLQLLKQSLTLKTQTDNTQ